jgi:signal transduction histidine kinase
MLRKQADFIIAVIGTTIVSVAMFRGEFFEWWYEYTRSHEDWELDEITSVMVAALMAGSLLAIHRSRLLKKANAELAQAQLILKANENEKAVREKMTALGQLSSGLAHEINNSLQPVLGLSDIIRANARKGDTETIECANMIYNSAVHMQSVVKQIMQVSRSGSEEVNEYDVAALLTDVMGFTTSLMPTTTEYSILYSNNFKDQVTGHTARISRTCFVQVVTNMLTNAAYAMKGFEGAVLIEIDMTSLNAQDASIRAIQPGSYLTIKISDKGCGMDEAILTRALEPFYTTKEEGEGIGLGLSTSYGTVRKWGGDLFIESALGVGTSVTFYIPTNGPEVKKKEG